MSISSKTRMTSFSRMRQHQYPTHYPSVVPRAGLEPALLAEQDFKSCVSTNSTTRAKLKFLIFSSKISKICSPLHILHYVPSVSLRNALLAGFSPGQPATFWRCRWDSNPRIKVLQTSALNHLATAPEPTLAYSNLFSMQRIIS